MHVIPFHMQDYFLNVLEVRIGRYSCRSKILQVPVRACMLRIDVLVCMQVRMHAYYPISYHYRYILSPSLQKEQL